MSEESFKVEVEMVHLEVDLEESVVDLLNYLSEISDLEVDKIMEGAIINMIVWNAIKARKRGEEKGD